MKQPEAPASCGREFIRYVPVNVLGMIGMSCYILADTYFVANGVGSEGLAALNLAIPAYGLMSGTGLMIGIGGAARYSIQLGQGEHEKANAMFTTSVGMGLLFGILFSLIGLFFAAPLARFLGADDSTFVMCRCYVRILLLFGPLFVMNYIMQAFLRNDGAPRRAMAAMLSGSLANIVLDYVFIYPLGLGILGAAAATVCAPAIGLLVSLSYVVQKKNRFHLVRCVPSLSRCRAICGAGIPPFVTEVSNGLVMFVFNRTLLVLVGTTGVAAYGVVANLSLVVISIYSGIAQGSQPLVSRDFGRRQIWRVQTALRYALIVVTVFSVLLYLGLFVQAQGVVGLFNESGSPQLQEIAVYGVRLYFTGCLFAGWNVVLSTSLAAGGQGRLASAISLLRGVVLIVPLAVILSMTAGMTGLWLSFPVTEGVVTIFGLVRHHKQGWQSIEK